MHSASRSDEHDEPCPVPDPVPRFSAGRCLLLGFLIAPGEWYAGLTKPSFNPPAWLFGPVWTVLYVLIAVAGWCVWGRARTDR
jgi:tryptophan-rich sensory protein